MSLTKIKEDYKIVYLIESKLVLYIDISLFKNHIHNVTETFISLLTYL